MGLIAAIEGCISAGLGRSISVAQPGGVRSAAVSTLTAKAHENNWSATCSIRPVHIGPQFRAIPHGHGHVVVNGNTVKIARLGHDRPPCFRKWIYTDGFAATPGPRSEEAVPATHRGRRDSLQTESRYEIRSAGRHASRHCTLMVTFY